MPVYLIQIAEGTHRPGVNNIGDVLRVGEGPTLPSGPGYKLYHGTDSGQYGEPTGLKAIIQAIVSWFKGLFGLRAEVIG